MGESVTLRPTGDPVRWPAAALTAAILVLLAGCSTPDWMAVPDWANPVEWFADDTPARESDSAEAPGLGDDDAFPKLSSVPDNPPPSSTEPERRAIADGLVADIKNARYTDQKLRAGAADEPIGRPSARSAQAKQPPVMHLELPVPSPCSAATIL